MNAGKLSVMGRVAMSHWVEALVLFIFGLVTFYLSGSILFDLFGVRETQGDYVNIVVFGNLLSSILYFYAVVGFLMRRESTMMVLVLALLILLISGGGLFYHIVNGGLYEQKTLGALTLRIFVTLIFIYRASKIKNIEENL